MWSFRCTWCVRKMGIWCWPIILCLTTWGSLWIGQAQTWDGSRTCLKVPYDKRKSFAISCWRKMSFKYRTLFLNTKQIVKRRDGSSLCPRKIRLGWAKWSYNCTLWCAWSISNNTNQKNCCRCCCWAYSNCCNIWFSVRESCCTGCTSCGSIVWCTRSTCICALKDGTIIDN